MGMEQRLVPRLEQRLRLSPRIIQSIEILQLPMLALEERVEQELTENPVLEVREEGPEVGEDGETTEPTDEVSTTAGEAEVAAPADDSDEPTPEEESEYERLENLVNDWEDFYSQTRRTPRSQDTDPKFEALQNTIERPLSLDEYLLSQLRLLDLEPRVWELAESIIYNLDEQGYLSTPLEEVVAPLLPPQAGDYDGSTELAEARSQALQQAEEALRVVQGLDPPGIGARDLAECLLLQITDDLPHADLARELVGGHLQDLLQNRLPAVAKATGHSLDEINQALKTIGQLNPRPGALFSHEVIPYVVPDLTVRYEDGRYRVVLNEGGVPGLYIRREYRELLRRRDGDPKLRNYVREKVRSAKWLMDAIEQRRHTLTRIAQVIVDHQLEFMEKGEGYLRPLKMQEVADEVGVHVATVSRAVSGKYLDTHHGIYELRYFFAGGLVTAEGTEESWKTVKQRIVRLIEQEEKGKPLSDQAVVDRLKDEGLKVARRTVTKYRKELNIPSARLRRQYGSEARP